MNENITVLKDESLGGIEREYREVKRKAAVGERIKIVKRWYSEDRYVNGDVFVTSSVRQSDGYVRVDSLGERKIALEEYVVLEPSEIVRIDDPDGVNRGYRMVDRKAAVGERVIVTNWLADKHVDGSAYKNGDVATATNDRVFVHIPHNDRIGYVALLESEYRVLEPVKSAAPLSAQPPLDQAAANIAALTAKVQALETQLRVAREDIILIEEGVADDIARLTDRVATLEKAKQPVKVAEGPADDAPPSFAKRCQTLQEIRDEIVERAKADVKRLERLYGIKFVVNRDKRTVVALQVDFDKDRVVDRAIAKCAPNDVFNSHIGKAIAARRLLWFDIPAEYLNVPNPEEPRVGDVVIYQNDVRGELTVHSEYSILPRGCTYLSTALTSEAIILDDSREEVGA